MLAGRLFRSRIAEGYILETHISPLPVGPSLRLLGSLISALCQHSLILSAEAAATRSMMNIIETINSAKRYLPWRIAEAIMAPTFKSR